MPTRPTSRRCRRRCVRPRICSRLVRLPGTRSARTSSTTTATRPGANLPRSTPPSPTGSVCVASNGSDRRPVIGITTYIERTRYGAWDLDAAVLPRTYIDTVAAAGGNPILLPPLGFSDVSFLDGLVIAGGADVDPARYGAAAHPETLGLRPDRDDTEFALVKNALAAGLPLIGVCRGMQVINVALGGTLTQHIPDVMGSSAHRPVVGQFGHTEVEMTPDSAINEIFGG